MILKDLVGTKFRAQQRPNKTAKQLFNIGRLAFLMMIDVNNVPVRNERERREVDRGYFKSKIKWIETNPLIPELFREVDRPRPKKVFKPRARPEVAAA
jgi:hypothetical protein